MICWLCVAALHLEYFKFLSPPRNPVVGDIQLSQGIALSLEVRGLESKLGFLYMRNRVHGEMEPAQFRLVGWQYELGVHAGPVEIYQHHHSQHLLDTQGMTRFPVEDAVGVRLILIDR